MAEYNIFLLNAAKLRELHDAVHATHKDRKVNPTAWEEACRRFHAEYDKLAFPGGLTNALSHLKMGDVSTIEGVVRFLEADPYYFRSGYNKVDMIKHLCRNRLSEDQKKRLQWVVLKQIRGRDQREFRAYWRLSKAVTDEGFCKELYTIAGASTGTVLRHAKWVLEHLRSSGLLRRKND